MIIQPHLDLSRSLRFVRTLLPVLLAYDVGVTVLYVTFHQQWIFINNIPLGLLGSAIALIVTFRNNAAYARWQDARLLWGAVLNNSRSLARGWLALSDDPVRQRQMITSQIAFAIALRHHLLRLPPWDEIGKYLPQCASQRLANVANVPAMIQMEMAAGLAAARAEGRVAEMGAAELNRIMSELANAQGGLERIKNTPMPRQYNHVPKLFTRLFCVLLPLTLVGDLGYMTPLGSTVIGFMFLALDQIGRNLEDPFEGKIHDVPMKAITRTIEIDLLQALGETEVPKPVAPVNGILW